MFNTKKKGKSRTAKLKDVGWIQLLYHIKNNIPAYVFSYAQYSALINSDKSKEIHENHCHPGITRLAHFVKVRNLQYSIEDVKRYTICAW